jgi:hypothetical protein
MKPQWEKVIWTGSGRAQSFKAEINPELKGRLIQGFNTAIRSRQEKLNSVNAGTLLESLKRRGFVVSSPLPVYDQDDVTGLVGEILTKEVLVMRGFEPLSSKFEASGTSKSRGIDLVMRKFVRRWELRLIEAKHLHKAMKEKATSDSPAEIRRRFSDGLDEFERDRTLVNLALVIIPLVHAARNARSTGASMADLESKIDFLISKLKDEDYTLEVAVCIDSKYCENSALDATVSPMLKRDEVGLHEVSLCLLETIGLEFFTTEVCSEYA